MSNKYGDFGGSTAGISERQWDYPTIGYNSSSGTFYIGDNQVKELKLTALKPRQCKEVVQPSGGSIRHPIYANLGNVNKDDVTYRLQMLVISDGQIYNFGMNKYTPNMCWMNPSDGSKGHNDRFDMGIWLQLMDHIKKVKVEDKIVLGTPCWEFTIKVSDRVMKVGKGQQSKVFPFELVSDFEYVGAAQATENDELFNTEDLEGWAKQWGNDIVEVEDEMVDPRDEQGGEQPPVMVSDETENDEEIPF